MIDDSPESPKILDLDLDSSLISPSDIHKRERFIYYRPEDLKIYPPLNVSTSEPPSPVTPELTSNISSPEDSPIVTPLGSKHSSMTNLPAAFSSTPNLISTRTEDANELELGQSFNADLISPSDKESKKKRNNLIKTFKSFTKSLGRLGGNRSKQEQQIQESFTPQKSEALLLLESGKHKEIEQRLQKVLIEKIEKLDRIIDIVAIPSTDKAIASFETFVKAKEEERDAKWAEAKRDFTRMFRPYDQMTKESVASDLVIGFFDGHSSSTTGGHLLKSHPAFAKTLERMNAAFETAKEAMQNIDGNSLSVQQLLHEERSTWEQGRDWKDISNGLKAISDSKYRDIKEVFLTVGNKVRAELGMPLVEESTNQKSQTEAISRSYWSVEKILNGVDESIEAFEDNDIPKLIEMAGGSNTLRMITTTLEQISWIKPAPEGLSQWVESARDKLNKEISKGFMVSHLGTNRTFQPEDKRAESIYFEPENKEMKAAAISAVKDLKGWFSSFKVAVAKELGLDSKQTELTEFNSRLQKTRDGLQSVFELRDQERKETTTQTMLDLPTIKSQLLEGTYQFAALGHELSNLAENGRLSQLPLFSDPKNPMPKNYLDHRISDELTLGNILEPDFIKAYKALDDEKKANLASNINRAQLDIKAQYDIDATEKLLSTGPEAFKQLHDALEQIAVAVETPSLPKHLLPAQILGVMNYTPSPRDHITKDIIPGIKLKDLCDDKFHEKIDTLSDIDRRKLAVGIHTMLRHIKTNEFEAVDPLVPKATRSTNLSSSIEERPIVKPQLPDVPHEELRASRSRHQYHRPQNSISAKNLRRVKSQPLSATEALLQPRRANTDSLLTEEKRSNREARIVRDISLEELQKKQNRRGMNMADLTKLAKEFDPNDVSKKDVETPNTFVIADKQTQKQNTPESSQAMPALVEQENQSNLKGAIDSHPIITVSYPTGDKIILGAGMQEICNTIIKQREREVTAVLSLGLAKNGTTLLVKTHPVKEPTEIDLTDSEPKNRSYGQGEVHVDIVPLPSGNTSIKFGSHEVTINHAHILKVKHSVGESLGKTIDSEGLQSTKKSKPKIG